MTRNQTAAFLIVQGPWHDPSGRSIVSIRMIATSSQAHRVRMIFRIFSAGGTEPLDMMPEQNILFDGSMYEREVNDPIILIAYQTHWYLKYIRAELNCLVAETLK